MVVIFGRLHYEVAQGHKDLPPRTNRGNLEPRWGFLLVFWLLLSLPKVRSTPSFDIALGVWQWQASFLRAKFTIDRKGCNWMVSFLRVATVLPKQLGWSYICEYSQHFRSLPPNSPITTSGREILGVLARWVKYLPTMKLQASWCVSGMRMSRPWVSEAL